jgi:hypothetical protein
MASERRNEANRRNAAKSSGPRSSAGRDRASRNSNRHGFAASRPLSAEQVRRVEKLARRIAGNASDPIILDHARSAAQAEFDLAQIRRVKVATIEQLLSVGETMPATPSELSDRTAEAVQLALPDLVKLDRYERHATARREQALRAISKTT